ncbi:MAG: Ig-like domain-containing protein, partial [Sulfurimonas sp.]|uniref:cadherin-like domain-containing protein n=1 Tax=Sulfurimonas sp. TaxID=2022749 RepID=UPI0028CEBD7E
MATGKVVGQIEVTEGNIKIVGVDGAVREPGFEGFLYENEQVISNDPEALFQIKFLALPEASAYDGVFRILADGSVIHGRDAMDSIASDENLVDILETAAVEDLETAAGEEGAEGGSAFTETDIIADSSVLGFSRGANGELGYGIVDFGTALDFDDTLIAPPAITSPNVIIYDENSTIPVTQVTAESQVDVSFSISGLDSDLFNIDSATGVVTFKESPDFENPKDVGGDNEYNIYVTATDRVGNFTTQLLSVSINNVNEAVTANDDTVNTVEDAVLSSTIDLDANDYDIDGDDLSVIPGTFATTAGGEIVIAADGSYTYTPPTNYNGTDSVGYTVTDGEFSDSGILTINVTPVNDAPTIDVTSVNNFTEDAPTNAVGSVVATYSTDDEEGSTVSVTLSDETNYVLGTGDDAGKVLLTQAGLDLVNAGTELPLFTLTPHDGTDYGTAATVDPTVTSLNDLPTIDVTSVNNFTEDAPTN